MFGHVENRGADLNFFKSNRDLRLQFIDKKFQNVFVGENLSDGKACLGLDYVEFKKCFG